jgi:hypothetical protein
METLNSFSNVLDEIFHDFEDAMPVIVFYNASEMGNPKRLQCKIQCVNGYLTLPDFTIAMNNLMVKLFNDILDAEEKLAPESRLVFLSEAMIRSKKLMSAVTRFKVSRKPGQSSSEPCEIRWAFRNLRCANLESLDVPKGAMKVIRLRVSRHAKVWHLIVQQIQKELQLFHAARKIFPAYGCIINHPFISIT